MPSIAIYSTDTDVQIQLTQIFERLSRDGSEPLRTRLYSSFGDFLSNGKQDPRCMLVLAQSGTESVELASTTVEECPGLSLIHILQGDYKLLLDMRNHALYFQASYF